MIKKWLDPNYIEHLRSLAKIYKTSGAINPDFAGDEGIILTLLMKADGWNVPPEAVLQGTYYDQHGGLLFRGRLIKLILSNSQDIANIDVSEIGDWKAVSNKFCVNSMLDGKINYQGTWDRSLEGSLGLTITITFAETVQKPELVVTMHLSDYDASVRNLNEKWVTSPRSQLENAMLRDLAMNQLYTYVHDFDMHGLEMDKRESADSDTDPVSEETPKQHSSDQSKPLDVLATAKGLQERLTQHAVLNEVNDAQLAMDQIMALVEQHACSMGSGDKAKLRAIYEECDLILTESLESAA